MFVLVQHSPERFTAFLVKAVKGSHFREAFHGITGQPAQGREVRQGATSRAGRSRHARMRSQSPSPSPLT